MLIKIPPPAGPSMVRACDVDLCVGGATDGPCAGALRRWGGVEQMGEGARRDLLRLPPLLATPATHRSWTGLPPAMGVKGRRGGDRLIVAPMRNGSGES